MNDSPKSLGGCIRRVFWAVLGPMILLLIGIMIVSQRDSALGIADAIYFVIAAFVIIARITDTGKIENPEQPVVTGKSVSSPAKFLAFFLIAAIGFWALARFVYPLVK